MKTMNTMSAEGPSRERALQSAYGHSEAANAASVGAHI